MTYAEKIRADDKRFEVHEVSFGLVSNTENCILGMCQ